MNVQTPTLAQSIEVARRIRIPLSALVQMKFP
jgi:hypothetical protein